ncbi:hypothetical protein I6F07_07935 [Ensifer sp. IC4062]|nr:hypothetical protein [Ensifer sp. IC4062]MCA1440149.1 hypothetical protein [Ensifer sp. IC4062]
MIGMIRLHVDILRKQCRLLCGLFQGRWQTCFLSLERAVKFWSRCSSETCRSRHREAAETFPHATSITTVERRKRLVEEYATKQEAIRGWVGSGMSKDELEAERVMASQKIKVLERNQAVMAAGLKAAILAVTTIGGFKMWAAHFAQYESSISILRELGALPSADIFPGTGSVQ